MITQRPNQGAKSSFLQRGSFCARGLIKERQSKGQSNISV